MNLKMRACILSAIVLCVVNPQSRAEGFQVSEGNKVSSHILQVEQSLPPGAPFRILLEHGARGDGHRYEWMDDMKREGVRRVDIQTSFVWDQRPTLIKLTNIDYHSKYDTDCSQIRDATELRRFKSSGLERKLTDSAIELVKTSDDWASFDQRNPTRLGIGVVEFLDDEWLPGPNVFLTPKHASADPLVHAISNEVSVEDWLAQGNYSKADLDGALMIASAYIDDSCIIKSIINAGANVNFRDSESGNTALINAATVGALRNVETLIGAGADATVADEAGRTALSIAESKKRLQIVKLLRDLGVK